MHGCMYVFNIHIFTYVRMYVCRMYDSVYVWMDGWMDGWMDVGR